MRVVRNVLAFFFGTEGTLKRETVVVLWVLIGIIVVRLYFFVPPALVHNYNEITSTILWAFILLLAAIFGIQVVPVLSGANRQVQETTTVETPTQTVTTKVNTGPAETTQPDPTQPPPGAAG